MPVLKTTSRGQATFRKEFFRHVGIEPGGQIEIEYLPNGEFRGRALRPRGNWDDFIGCLAGKSNVRLTIEEMNEVIGKAAAKSGMAGLKR